MSAEWQSTTDREEIMDRQSFGVEGWTEAEGSEHYQSPLSQLIGVEEEILGLSPEKVRQIRMESMRLLLISLVGNPDVTPDLVRIGENVATWCWDLELAPFHKMSQEDIAALAGKGRAAVCERHKKQTKSKGRKSGRKSHRGTAGAVRAHLATQATGNKNRSGAAAEDIFSRNYGSEPNQPTKKHE